MKKCANSFYKFMLDKHNKAQAQIKKQRKRRRNAVLGNTAIGSRKNSRSPSKNSVTQDLNRNNSPGTSSPGSGPETEDGDTFNSVSDSPFHQAKRAYMRNLLSNEGWLEKELQQPLSYPASLPHNWIDPTMRSGCVWLGGERENWKDKEDAFNEASLDGSFLSSTTLSSHSASFDATGQPVAEENGLANEV